MRGKGGDVLRQLSQSLFWLVKSSVNNHWLGILGVVVLAQPPCEEDQLGLILQGSLAEGDMWRLALRDRSLFSLPFGPRP